MAQCPFTLRHLVLLPTIYTVDSKVVLGWFIQLWSREVMRIDDMAILCSLLHLPYVYHHLPLSLSRSWNPNSYFPHEDWSQLSREDISIGSSLMNRNSKIESVGRVWRRCRSVGALSMTCTLVDPSSTWACLLDYFGNQLLIQVSNCLYCSSGSRLSFECFNL
jgi:hypothetical protein